jgi:glutathione S-transferase
LVELAGLKQLAYEAVNPNGRVPGSFFPFPLSYSYIPPPYNEPPLNQPKPKPKLQTNSPRAIYDPNTNLTLWESGAIVTYLITKYDTTHKISYPLPVPFPSPPSADEQLYFHCLQWQHFQSSGHGPYLGQAAWFVLFHHEPLASARTRYVTEARRVVRVLDRWLRGDWADRSGPPTTAAAEEEDEEAHEAKKTPRLWLVGSRCTYADLAFVSWNAALGLFLTPAAEDPAAAAPPPTTWDAEAKSEFPHFWAWQERMLARPSVQKALGLAAVEDVRGWNRAGKEAVDCNGSAEAERREVEA